jgi:hypothetical protein
LPACELGEAQAALVSLDGEPAGPAPLGVWAADSSGVYHLTPGEPAGPLAFSALPEGQPQVIHPDPGIGQVLQLLGAVDSTP